MTGNKKISLPAGKYTGEERRKMSYYNDVYAIFKNGEGLDWRTAGQMLPAGAIPVAVANTHNRIITEVINEFEAKKVIDFTNQVLEKEINWEYIPS